MTRTLIGLTALMLLGCRGARADSGRRAGGAAQGGHTAGLGRRDPGRHRLPQAVRCLRGPAQQDRERPAQAAEGRQARADRSGAGGAQPGHRRRPGQRQARRRVRAGRGRLPAADPGERVQRRRRQAAAGVDSGRKPDRPPVRINGPYPDAIPLSTMPPQMLSALPKLPEELEYRFVGDASSSSTPTRTSSSTTWTRVLPRSEACEP